MKNLSLILTILSLTLIGCQKKEATAEAGHDETSEGAIFKEGHGLSFAPETKAAIGLDTAEAENREIGHAVPLTAQVYRAADEVAHPGRVEKAGMAYASALLEPKLAEQFKVGDAVKSKAIEGKIVRVDATQQGGVGKSEILIELPDPGNTLRVGTFLPIEAGLAKLESVAIPSSAVLETAAGLFAYVQNGESLLRTPITTGITDGQWVEVTDGLYEGDVVATKPVSSLYLIELRATKGGGHCH